MISKDPRFWMWSQPLSTPEIKYRSFLILGAIVVKLSFDIAARLLPEALSSRIYAGIFVTWKGSISYIRWCWYSRIFAKCIRWSCLAWTHPPDTHHGKVNWKGRTIRLFVSDSSAPNDTFMLYKVESLRCGLQQCQGCGLGIASPISSHKNQGIVRIGGCG